MKLTEWVPALARELWGKKWSPNCDFIIHLQAQQTARELGITWGMDIPSPAVNQISDALRVQYRK